MARHVWEQIKGSGMRLALDANRGWTMRDAQFVSRGCAGIPLVIEQPCASLQELQALRPLLCHPLYMDESSEDLGIVTEAIGRRQADGFGMKLTRIGGLHPMRLSATSARPAACRIPATMPGAAIFWPPPAPMSAQLCGRTCWKASGSQRLTSTGIMTARPGSALRTAILPCRRDRGLGVMPDESLFGAPVASF